jgi:hypothetical protein
MRFSPPPSPPSPAKHTALLCRALSQPWGCRAGPGRASVTDSAQCPPRRVTDRPGVSGRARSVRTRITPDSVTAVGGAGPGPVGLLWRTRPGTPTAGDWSTGSAGPGSSSPYKSYAGLGRPFVTDRPDTPMAGDWPVGSAELGPVGLTDPSSTDVVNLYIR